MKVIKINNKYVKVKFIYLRKPRARVSKFHVKFIYRRNAIRLIKMGLTECLLNSPLVKQVSRSERAGDLAGSPGR